MVQAPGLHWGWAVATLALYFLIEVGAMLLAACPQVACGLKPVRISLFAWECRLVGGLILLSLALAIADLAPDALAYLRLVAV